MSDFSLRFFFLPRFKDYSLKSLNLLYFFEISKVFSRFFSKSKENVLLLLLLFSSIVELQIILFSVKFVEFELLNVEVEF